MLLSIAILATPAHTATVLMRLLRITRKVTVDKVEYTKQTARTVGATTIPKA